MKQKLLVIILLIVGLSFSSELNAQSKTKCPPGKSFFKSKERKGFLSRIFGNKHKDRPQARVFYQPEPVVSKQKEQKEERVAQASPVKYRESRYKRNKRAAKRRARQNSNQVATTACPRR